MLGRPANPVNQSLLSVRKIRGGGCAFRLAACVAPSLTVLRHSQLRRFLKTDSTDRGKEAPVFGSRDPLFLDSSSPKTQVTECSISSWVGDDQRIPSVVCFLPCSLRYQVISGARARLGGQYTELHLRMNVTYK